jgi:hypothetical protein
LFRLPEGFQPRADGNQRKTPHTAANPIVCGRGPRFRPPRQRYDL